ncbi:MAG: phosphoribosyltransferase [Bacteroidetes bacterium]|nr:phosphoribosyltransferase [Bacteroidota bacterium]
MAEQNLILTEAQVKQILRRIAFEIYENNFNEKHIILVGVYDKGYLIAEMIKNQLDQVVEEGMKTTLVRLDINKENPVSSDVTLDIPHEKLKGKSIILIDDVLNTGKTVAHCLKSLLEVEIKKIETAVLVNRSHKAFPISANYKGYELSTTIDEHVDVRLGEGAGVYLF